MKGAWSNVVIALIFGMPLYLILYYYIGTQEQKKEIRGIFSIKGIQDFLGGLGALSQICFGIAFLLFVLIMIIWLIKFIWHIVPV